MKDIRILSGKRITPSIETVTALCGVKMPDAAGNTIQELFLHLLPSVQMRLRPRAALTIDLLRIPSDSGRAQKTVKALFAILTVGDSVSRMIQTAMEQQDMLQALVLDAMADSCLFAFEEQLLPSVQQICFEEGYGIERRIELTKDVPADVQKDIFEALDADRSLGVSMTSGFMLRPEKSMSLLFELTDDTEKQAPGHNCGACSAAGCALRKEQTLKVTAELVPPAGCGEKPVQKQFSCRKGSILLDVLSEHGISLPAYCGRRGSCGKCRVQLKKGILPVTAQDRAAFSRQQLQHGMRLSCQAVLQDDITVCINKEESGAFQALGVTEPSSASENRRPAEKDHSCRYGIAIDIGTTTLAFSLIRLPDGGIMDTYTAVNSQRFFGADVLSRMQADNAGKGQPLRRAVQADLLNGIFALLNRNSLSPASLGDIVIAANTVMLHLLRGYSCEGLSRHPFTPVTLDIEEISLLELFRDLPEYTGPSLLPEQITVTLLPGISAFVGADITAGLYACDVLNAGENTLFLDLGTNGEMAFQKGHTLYTASAAAGPAFEAANIKWGMPGVAGAISEVAIRGGIPKITTIGECPPAGICGTGVMETIAELLAAGLMDSTGKLNEPYFLSGYPLAQNEQGEQIALLQQDIREIQMAKAAIRAGMETLLIHSGAQWEEVGQIYLAGGFGYFLNVKKAASVGLLPQTAASKTKAVGNTALKGAILYLETKNGTALQEIIKSAKSISLAEDEKFQELYLDHISF